jgi:hypothetical protein
MRRVAIAGLSSGGWNTDGVPMNFHGFVACRALIVANKGEALNMHNTEPLVAAPSQRGQSRTI